MDDFSNLSEDEIKLLILEARLSRERTLAEKSKLLYEIDAGTCIRKEEIYGELAARVIAFDVQVKSAVKSKMKDIIKQCEGDLSQIAVCQSILIEAINVALAEMSNYQTWEVGLSSGKTVDEQKMAKRTEKRNLKEKKANVKNRKR